MPKSIFENKRAVGEIDKNFLQIFVNLIDKISDFVVLGLVS